MSTRFSASPNNINAFVQAARASVARAESMQRSPPDHLMVSNFESPRQSTVPLPPAPPRPPIPVELPAAPPVSTLDTAERVQTPKRPTKQQHASAQKENSRANPNLVAVVAPPATKRAPSTAVVASKRPPKPVPQTAATRTFTAGEMRRVGAPVYNRLVDIFYCPFCNAGMKGAGYRTRRAEERRRQQQKKEQRSTVDGDGEDPTHCNFCASDTATGEWTICRECAFLLCSRCALDIKADGRYDDPMAVVCGGCKLLVAQGEEAHHAAQLCRGRRTGGGERHSGMVKPSMTRSPPMQSSHLPPHLSAVNDDDDDAGFIAPSTVLVSSQPIQSVHPALPHRPSNQESLDLIAASAARAQRQGVHNAEFLAPGVNSTRKIPTRQPTTRQAVALANTAPPTPPAKTLYLSGVPPTATPVRLEQFLEAPSGAVMLDVVAGTAHAVFPSQIQAWNANLRCQDHLFDGRRLTSELH